jgi:hypothetical protein
MRESRLSCAFAASVILFSWLSLDPGAAFADGTTPGAAWKITRAAWTPTDERGYSAFVQAIGESDCHSIESCLSGPANPYRASDPAGLDIKGDCSKLPYFLRAYYAWKNGLPFGYVSDVEEITLPGAPTPEPGPSASPTPPVDLRYTPNGNRVIERHSVITRADGQFPDAIHVLTAIFDLVSSAAYRIDPTQEVSPLLSDLYPARIDRESIRPGTVIYDTSGHVTLIYKVDADGQIHYIDTHPDYSLTHGLYGAKFVRSRPAMGGGFKNFRPIQLVGATRDAEGNLIGGKIVLTPSSKIADYSLEQYFGNQPSPNGDWRQGRFLIDDQTLDFQDYVRHALATETLRYDPLFELNTMLGGLCQDLHDRVDAVQLAVTAGISAQAHPVALPLNIYGTEGDWETYSTSSRDARLKTSFKEVRDRLAQFLDEEQSHPELLNYQGKNLKSDLATQFTSASSACQIQYKKSDGTSQSVSLRSLFGRVFSLSFDPYHCVELRWGESSAQALQACADDSSKREWYSAEQRLRNQLDRTYDLPMNFTLMDLEAKKIGSGIDLPPDVNVEQLLGID